MSQPIYFTDSDSTLLRVHDACFGPPLAAPGQHRVVLLGDPRANTRYFVSEARVVRFAHLKRFDSRATDAETLARHFSAAGFVAQSAANLAAKRGR